MLAYVFPPVSFIEAVYHSLNPGPWNLWNPWNIRPVELWNPDPGPCTLDPGTSRLWNLESGSLDCGSLYSGPWEVQARHAGLWKPGLWKSGLWNSGLWALDSGSLDSGSLVTLRIYKDFLRRSYANPTQLRGFE